MTAHVFIVNEDTFPAHLEYMFAGTSSGKQDYNISLLADIKRVRADDRVIFYFEGVGFYGIFKIKNNNDSDSKQIVYYDKDNFCNGKLKKKLLYRVLIEPEEIYSEPVDEWEALEKLPDNPRDIIWSLIYRKLKGGRGCTPVTPKESEKLIELIRNKNYKSPLNLTGGFSWENGKIVKTKNTFQYDTNKASIPNIEKMIFKKKKVETYLQAYFTENAGVKKFDDTVFARICGRKDEINWLGNEVFCGVGMQKIDIFTITNSPDRQFRVIELKTVLDLNICYQLERYVKWCLDYLNGSQNGTKPENLCPAIVLPKTSTQSEKKDSDKLLKNLMKFNAEFKDKCQPVRYFEFKFDENKNIVFNEKLH